MFATNAFPTEIKPLGRETKPISRPKHYQAKEDTTQVSILAGAQGKIAPPNSGAQGKIAQAISLTTNPPSKPLSQKKEGVDPK